MKKLEIFSIGHSSRSWLEFIDLLRAWQISAIADVRSIPKSRHEQFNREHLHYELAEEGLVYRFLGNKLGGRPKKASLFSDGVADYQKMANEPKFRQGIDQVIKGAENHRLALMCSEYNPIECHRTLLVGRSLKDRSIDLTHIISETEAMSQERIEEEIMSKTGIAQGNFLNPVNGNPVDEAYRDWGFRVAFSINRDYSKSSQTVTAK